MHVEAGLRSWRDDMPEERNRVETDRLSDVLFAPDEGARRNLEAEGVRGTRPRHRRPAVRHAASLARPHRRRRRRRRTCSRPSTATTTPTTRRACATVLDCLGRSPVARSCSPCTRAPARRSPSGASSVPANVELRRAGPLHAHAGPRARRRRRSPRTPAASSARPTSGACAA